MDGDLRFWVEESGQRIRVDLWNMQLETILKETNGVYALSGTAAVTKVCGHCVVSHAPCL